MIDITLLILQSHIVDNFFQPQITRVYTDGCFLSGNFKQEKFERIFNSYCDIVDNFFTFEIRNILERSFNRSILYPIIFVEDKSILILQFHIVDNFFNQGLRRFAQMILV